MISIEEIEEGLGHQLSDEQKKILEHDNKHPLSIVACAGSGKTTTIETKMIYDILNNQINADDILCVTFSKRAQNDMNEKYDKLYEKITDEQPKRYPRFSTFHSLFKYLIDQFMRLNYYNVLQSYTSYQSKLMKALNYKVQSGVDLKLVLKEIFAYYGRNINTMVSIDGLSGVNGVPNGANFTLNEYKQVIDYYQRLKNEDSVIDFDDMQVILLQILQSDRILDQNIAQSIIDYFNDTYQHVYVDEYQDISPIQHTILEMLLDGHYEKLIVVGDDDQSIYRFRGSDPRFILDFTDEIPNSEVLYLNTNYRCKSNILTPASSMIESNKIRFDKNITAFKENGIFDIINDDELSSRAIKMMKEDFNSNPDKSFAILCRHNIQLSLIADLMVQYDVPVILNNHEQQNLQSNYLYRDLIDTIKAVKYNDLDAFRRVSYKIFIFLSRLNTNEIIKKAEKEKVHWFQVFMSNRYFTQTSLLDVKNIKESMEQTDNARLLIEYAFSMIKGYYKMLEEKKQSNQYSRLEMITDHVIRLLNEDLSMSFDEFILDEENKVNQLGINEQIDEGIHLITFHSAKGLEFDNVYIINANHQVTPGTFRLSSYVMDKDLVSIINAFNDLEEERRLFYVACTRAKDKLIISNFTGQQSIFVDEMKYDEHYSLDHALQNNPYFATLLNILANQLLEFNGCVSSKAQGLLGQYLTSQFVSHISTYYDASEGYIKEMNKVALNRYHEKYN